MRANNRYGAISTNLYHGEISVQRPWDDGSTQESEFIPVSDTVDALCWCQREVVKIPQPWVRAGKTGVCGNPGCKEHDRPS